MSRALKLAARIAGTLSRPTLFVQYGMKRSGNHAVSDWLISRLDVTYFNNIVAMGDVYAGRAEVPDLSDYHLWSLSRSKRQVPSLGRRLLQGRAAMPSRAYVSLEDLPTDLDAFASAGPTRILILRSFENMMSSRIRKAFSLEMDAYPREMGPTLRRVIETWKQHARCYLRASQDTPDRAAIQFDAFAVDPEYRAAICRRLGIPPGDEGLERVSSEGGGSSFDGTRFDGRANEMGVSRRLDYLEPHELALLEEILKDAELRGLADAVLRSDPAEQL